MGSHYLRPISGHELTTMQPLIGVKMKAACKMIFWTFFAAVHIALIALDPVRGVAVLLLSKILQEAFGCRAKSLGK